MFQFCAILRSVDLQELSDRAEITDVLVRYTRAIDTGDWDRLDTVFTPDARIDYTESGGIAGGFPEVKPWLAEMLPAFFPLRMHTLGQVEIRLDGDAAEVSAYFHNPMPMDDGHGGSKLVEIGGLYHHSMRRTADGWRSVRLREEVVWKQNI
ncbi:MAG TPA: nuclear transport factor 2 family protein [Nocardioides sp.]|uniref:nuclear transport factor 2 family protein n=1 Tax=uncultured Nocardioides sp. TaxID=198441 RepID=UPI00262AD1DF|nr:nuclear transport factor 2 family protein [uncultured Nocardioides sp.]HRD60728.1 nuclear transport factor 2 family protein [Nocardioides sp.]HRI95412.1 nuclear transport factor 2 family protein [Nocardioides sp.]HRK46829.1 nuclear transport factor 2 family protein [Nocardioides sp.]